MIGVLNAYHFDFTPGHYQESYNKDISNFLAMALPSQNVRHYKIAKNEWPLSHDECTAWFITGSSKGVYDNEPWLQPLMALIRELDQRQKKLIGICFGHQIIAQALGGKVEKSPKGWGVGVKTFRVVQPQPWMNPQQQQLSLLFSHQDQVVELPPQAKLLAQDDFCPYQMFQVGHHILTMQCHPEFTVEFATKRLLARQNLIEPATYKKAMLSLTQYRDDKILASWVREFIKL